MSAFILPPVNAEAINTSDARFGIADAMLVASSVPELPPSAYVAGTTYANGAQVNTGTVGQVITVWQSLQPANTGHAPLSSPAWWKKIGETFADWTPGTWAEGDRVIRAVANLHTVFQRLAPGGSDSTAPELDATKWARVGTTNRWAMFDMLSAESTAAISPLVIKLSPGRISGLALLAADVGNVHIEMRSDGALVYEAFDTFDSTPVGSWDDYFFAEFSAKSNVIRLDLPTFTFGEITITITSASGFITLGKVIVGTGQALGGMLQSPRVRLKSYSTVARDDFGDITGIKRRKSVSLVSAQLMVEKAVVLRAKAALDAARTTPCVFQGLSTDTGAYAELLTFLAICTDSDVDPAHAESALINVELEGI